MSEMKIVLDTNVLISGIFWKGAPHKILELWIHGHAQIFASRKIFEEYSAVLRRIDQSQVLAKKWQRFIVENITIIAVKEVLQLCRDPHDDMFINCALAANASYIVSGDQDLLVLKKVSKIKIVTPAEFLKIFGKMS